MAKPLVSEELWEVLQPLLPPPKPRRFRYPGRQPVGDRQTLTGILFVLKTGIPWEDLPNVKMGCGCGMTRWRRLNAWQNASASGLDSSRSCSKRLDDAGKIDWSRPAVDGTFGLRLRGRRGQWKKPTDRGRPGVKQHVLVGRPRHPPGRGFDSGEPAGAPGTAPPGG